MKCCSKKPRTSKERRLANALKRDREVLVRMVHMAQSKTSRVTNERINEWLVGVRQLEAELRGLNPRHPLLKRPVIVRVEVRQFQRGKR